MCWFYGRHVEMFLELVLTTIFICCGSFFALSFLEDVQCCNKFIDYLWVCVITCTFWINTFIYFGNDYQIFQFYFFVHISTKNILFLCVTVWDIAMFQLVILGVWNRCFLMLQYKQSWMLKRGALTWMLQQIWKLQSFFPMFHTLDSIVEIVSSLMLQWQNLSTSVYDKRLIIFDVPMSLHLSCAGGTMHGAMVVCGGAPATVDLVFFLLLRDGVVTPVVHHLDAIYNTPGCY